MIEHGQLINGWEVYSCLVSSCLPSEEYKLSKGDDRLLVSHRGGCLKKEAFIRIGDELAYRTPSEFLCRRSVECWQHELEHATLWAEGKAKLPEVPD